LVISRCPPTIVAITGSSSASIGSAGRFSGAARAGSGSVAYRNEPVSHSASFCRIATMSSIW
jgi:hypothetical protein